MWAYDAFLREAELLVARARAQRQGRDTVAAWEWRHGARPHLSGNSFLVSRDNPRLIQRKQAPASSWVLDGVSTAEQGELHHEAIDDINALLDEDHDGPIELEDQATLPPVVIGDAAADAETVLFEFHIVFHAVYQTPVLFFRLAQLDGAPIRFSDDMIQELRLPGGNARAALVAMEEHPVLGTPFYVLHPCETASAMALLLQEPAARHDQRHEKEEQSRESSETEAAPTYLLAWLSLVQPLTGINPLLY